MAHTYKYEPDYKEHEAQHRVMRQREAERRRKEARWNDAVDYVLAQMMEDHHAQH